MPKLFPDPVCVLPGEYGLVAAVLAAPLDDLPKLVYADWLEERDDPRAGFLRTWLAARQAGKPLPHPDRGMSECWLSVVGFTLDEWLSQHGNPAWANAVRALAEPCVMVQCVPLKEDGEVVETGRSKMGGLPDLDPDTAWPVGDDGEMAFIAQWNLADLATSPCCAKLPKQGILSFFIDLPPFVQDSDGRSEVIFNPDPDELDEREPEEMHEDNDLPACRIEFRECLSLPDYRSPVWDKFELSGVVLRNFSDLQYGYPTPDGSHCLLGHAVPIQEDPTPARETRLWSLLTQFGPDDGLRLEACDGGTWYFMIPDADLKRGKFDDVYMEFQTG